MTDSNKTLYEYIVQYKRDHDGLSPTYEQIMQNCGIASKSTVGYKLRRLEDDGLIRLLRNEKNYVQGIMVNRGRWSLSDVVW